MSKTLSAAAQTAFDSEVKHAYQQGSKLRDCVTIRTNVTGSTYEFRHMGKGQANQKPSQADVTPMDIAHTKPVATLSNWNAPEYTDIFDAAEVNFEEQQELAETIAMALGRRVDQLIIDALDAEASPAGTVVHGSTGITFAKINEGHRHLNESGVPGGNRTIAISAHGLEDSLNQEKLTSADYQTIRGLVDGTINTAFGLTWKCIEERDEGGLPKATNTRSNFMFHKQAIGYAEGIGPRTEVNYVAQKTSWLANGVLKAGAVSRDGEGIVEVQGDES